MRRAKALRRTALAVGITTASLLFLWVSLPVWFPWLLRPFAAKAGVHYTRYERLGYSRFALNDLAYTNRATQIRVRKLEAMVPNVWLWRVWHPSDPDHATPFAQVSDWRVEISPRPTANTNSVYGIVREWQSNLDTAVSWIPLLTLSNGVVALPEGEFRLPHAGLTNGNLKTELEFPTLGQSATATVGLKRTPVYRAIVHSDTLALEASLDLSTSSQGLHLRGSALWITNRIGFEARFAPVGSWPETATLEAPNLLIPATRLNLPYYRDLRGSADFHWDSNRFSLDLVGRAEPLPSITNSPPLDLNLHVRGDTNSVVVHGAEVISPWLTARLSKEISLYRTGSVLHEPANLDLVVDLSRQPWYPAEGVLRGEARFQPTGRRLPSALFQLTGTNVSTHGLEASRLDLHGTFDWPRLEISSAEYTFEEDSTATLSGNLIIPEKSVEAGKFAFDGPLLQRWLTAGFGYETLTATGHFSGPIAGLAHNVGFQVKNVEVPGLKPFNATIVESGHFLDLQQLDIALTSERSLLQMRSAADLSAGTNAVLHIQTFSLSRKDQEQLTLRKPVDLCLGRSATNGFVSLKLDGFDWIGPGGQLQAEAALQWPAVGHIHASGFNLSPTLVQDFVSASLLPVELASVDFRADWTNGPANLAVCLSLREAKPRTLAADLVMSGDGRGLSVRECRILSGTNLLLTAEGFLPLILQPAAPGRILDLRTNSALQFKAEARPSGLLWDQLAKATGLGFRNPRLRLELLGTLASPRGEIDFEAAQANLSTSQRSLPSLEAIRTHISVTPHEARLEELSVRIQGQPVSVTALIPLDESFWTGLRRGKFTGWDRASARVQIEDAELAAFAPLFPDLLAPQGQLNLDLSLAPGLVTSGEMTIQNARTRSFGTWGSLRDIQLRLRFQDRTARLQTGLARLGGATVTMGGAVNLAGTDWIKEGIPPFQFNLKGTNVPLVRQPEFIVRSDLDLAVVKTNGAPALISGQAQLRDSFYLSDLQALVPGKIATPKRRPPYFSIEKEPFADWRLAVHVSGDHFLQVRSALYNGQVSSNLRLQGTLKDPLALGDLSIDSGTVRFPFASLKVDHGLVTLTSENPYHPTLNVLATTKQYGYDIRMEASGPVDAPILQFSSSPPLSPEQIVLLVTAGELPRGEYSLSAQQRAQGLALFLAKDLLAKIGLGDGAEQRLIVRSGEQISQQGTPTYYIEYKLNDTWSLVGEYDRFGDVNAGAKWRVFSR